MKMIVDQNHKKVSLKKKTNTFDSVVALCEGQEFTFNAFETQDYQQLLLK